MPKPLALLKQLLENLTRKPATVEYGWKVKPTPSQGYRGLHRVDPNKCIGCGLCALECPPGAIQMKVVPGLRGPGNRPKKLPVIHYYLCIFCYHCVDICPRKAYITTNQPPEPVEKKEQLVEDPTSQLLKTMQQNK